MKNKHLAAVASTLVVTALCSAAVAQEEDQQAPYVVPVDTFTCSYNDGQDMGDLKKTIGEWNAYMDEQGADTYGAFVVTPQYYGKDTFEVGWLGFWNSQESMGAGMDRYRASGAKIQESFGKVLTCETHSHFASIQVKAPPEGEVPDDIVLMFSNCTMNEEVEWDDLYARIGKAMAYLDSQGNESGEWMMWPVFGGEGKPDWDFKWVSSYANYTAFGKAYQHNANGGGRQKMNEIMGDTLDCDAARVYDAHTVRRVTAEIGAE